MTLIILGPQGSGKGTQGGLLVAKYGMNYVDMGRILRSVHQVKDYVNRGELVPDELVRTIAWDHINKQDKSKGFLFDGYPRSVPQYEALQDMLRRFGKKIERVIWLDISEVESIRRLSARRTCEKCGEIYNSITRPPQKPDVCDKCGGKLVQRKDDTPEAIKRRLQLYHEQTHPILEKARGEGILLEVNGERAIETIFEEIISRL